MKEKDLLAVAGILLFLVFLGSVGMMGFFGFHIFFMGVGIILVVGLVVFLCKYASSCSEKEYPEKALKDRLSRGEISLEEYEKISKALRE